jgi:predicted regulator of Ras-like GTPase activity (Roadblock/LC7/MglB family)
LVEPALKRGRVTFSWKFLRALLRPAPMPASVHDSVEVELPLKVVAPLFFARPKQVTRLQQKVSAAQEIPDLFFGFPQPPPAATASPALPVPPATPVVKPVDQKIADTNFYVWGENSEVPKIDETEYRRAPAPATDFTSRYATPKDIVERTAALPGVAGAVVALPDGLRVASQVPADLNADTLAAFLPQIFDRLGQSTRELRMGSLNNVSFTVGNVPWKIFRVNSVYFAAFGRAGEALPGSQLALLATQLDRKKQQ